MKFALRAVALLAPIAALSVAAAAQASESSTSAAVDLIIDTDSNTAGGVSQAAMTSGASSAQATADLFSIRVIGTDNGAHFAPGRPEAGGQSDFAFEVQGTTGVIQLTFNFETAGGFVFPADNYTANGVFSALLRSASDVSPYVLGDFGVVQASCCGGRIAYGDVRTFPDYFDTATFSSTPWDGANPGNFSLTTTFLAGVADAGQLGLIARGAGGSVDFDFGLRLASITTTSTVRGLSIYDADTGQRFAITSASVPEPGAWALMILGFGLAGGALRIRPRLAAG